MSKDDDGTNMIDAALAEFDVGYAESAVLSDEQIRKLRKALLDGAPVDLARRAARIPKKTMDAALKEEEVELMVDQAEAVAEVILLRLTADTRPLEVLARTRPRDYGPSVARPLTDEDGDDGINLDPD